MEYQTQYMLLKKYEIRDNNFCCANPFGCEGFVQIKKEWENCSIAIQINSGKCPQKIVIVSAGKTYCYSVNGLAIKLEINCDIDFKKICVFVPTLQLFATSDSMANCAHAYWQAFCTKNLEKLDNKNNYTALEKIFGRPIPCTYFFDCIKGKLAAVFAIGKPCPSLSQKFGNSKWVIIPEGGKQKVIGVVYQSGFAIAIGVGELLQAKTNDETKATLLDGENFYNIRFLSAENGKIIQI
jgi:hypothetical protein